MMDVLFKIHINGKIPGVLINNNNNLESVILFLKIFFLSN